MQRSTVATLATAVVVGLTSGSVTAFVRGDGDVPADRSSQLTTTAAPGRLLYLDGDTIHDGDTTVRLDEEVPDVVRLVRVAHGWVLAQDVGTTEPDAVLWHVRPDGTTSRVAQVFGPWDVDPSGTRVAGSETDDAHTRVWTLDGQVVADAGVVPEVRATVWQGNGAVVISVVTGDEGSWRYYRWPMGRKPRLGDTVGMEDVTASRSGRLLVGRSSSGGTATPAGPNTCLRVDSAPGSVPRGGAAVGVQSCDWVPMSGTGAVVSPDGSRVMGMPSDTDGFGPGEVATFSSRRGVREDLAVVDLPDRTLGVQWLDADHVVATVASDLELDDRTGTSLQVCTLAGSCRTVASRDHGSLLVGEQY